MAKHRTPPTSPSPRPQGHSAGARVSDYRSAGTRVSDYAASTTDESLTQPIYVSPPLSGKRAGNRRLVKRWGILAAIAVPFLGFLIYDLVGGSGSAEIGQTVTQRSGIALSVGGAQRYTPANASLTVAGEQVYQVIVAVNNPTNETISSSQVNITATVNGAAVEAVYPEGPVVQPIEPHVQLNMPYWFTVKDGTTGPLLVTVQNGIDKPVYFKGSV